MTAAEMCELYREAIITYGEEMQTLVCFEELAELQKELCKHARGEDNVEHIAEEIADASIMLEQMTLLHGCEELVRKYRAAKLERLKARISGAAARRGGY